MTIADPTEPIYRKGWPATNAVFEYEWQGKDVLRITARTDYATWLFVGNAEDGPLWMLVDDIDWAEARYLPDGKSIEFRATWKHAPAVPEIVQ